MLCNVPHLEELEDVGDHDGDPAEGRPYDPGHGLAGPELVPGQTVPAAVHIQAVLLLLLQQSSIHFLVLIIYSSSS